MAGFFLLHPNYREGKARRQIAEKLEALGFEVYETGKPQFLVFYVEGETVNELIDKIRVAEGIEGVVKAYIAYGFLADKRVEEEINRGLETGEIVLDESTIEYIKGILERLGVKISEG